MHQLGFYHEHSRTDRDEYVTVLTENIQESQALNFDIETESDHFDLPYDYNSVMHYFSTTFSKNGLPTLQSKTSTPIAPASDVTLHDINKIRHLVGEVELETNSARLKYVFNSLVLNLIFHWVLRN